MWIIAECICGSFAGARANKDGYREPEPDSLGDLAGYHERCARKYRDVRLNLRANEKKRRRKRRVKGDEAELLLVQ